MNPLISIIIPVYNCEEKISRCLDSLLKQSFKTFEIVIIDDGSTDNSYDLCSYYASKYEFIRLFKETNGGVSKARNYGISLSNGKYIVFVDADDFVHKNFLLFLYNGLKKADMSLWGMKRIYKYKKVRCSSRRNTIYDLSTYVDGIIDLFDNKILNSPCNKLYEKKKIDYFDEDIKVGEDLIFNLHYLSKIKNVFSMKKNLYYYDCTGESTMHKYRPNAILEQCFLYYNFYNILKNNYEKVDIMYFSMKLRNSLNNSFINVFYYSFNDEEIKEIYDTWLKDLYVKNVLDFFNLKEFNNCDVLFERFKKIYKKRNSLSKVIAKKILSMIKNN